MSLNSLPVTDLRPEVELMHLLRMRMHIIIVFETNGIEQITSSLERYFVFITFSFTFFYKLKYMCTSVIPMTPYSDCSDSFLVLL